MGAREAVALARERGLRAKKSFGQNFLGDRAIAGRIAALAGEGGTAVEIGAGLGALTEPLLERCSRVVAIERDRDLVPILREAFADEPRLTILEADAAAEDWAALLGSGPEPRVVAGNLPYQLSGRLVRRAVVFRTAISRGVFMLQREVAERLVASPATPAYGASTVFAQAAFEVGLALKVPAGAFHPPPKVASAVVVLEPRATPIAEEDDAFRVVVKGAFAQRRKKLRSAWKRVPGALDAAAAAGVDVDRRGETLDVAELAAVAEALRR